jgi:hypothetical protein
MALHYTHCRAETVRPADMVWLRELLTTHTLYHTAIPRPHSAARPERRSTQATHRPSEVLGPGGCASLRRSSPPEIAAIAPGSPWSGSRSAATTRTACCLVTAPAPAHSKAQPAAGADDFCRLNSGSALKMRSFRTATMFAV